MLRKTSLGLAALTAAALLVGGAGTAAEARTHVSVGIGLGLPGYYGGGYGGYPGYYGGSYYSPCPPYGYGYGYGACYAPPPVIGFGFYGGHGGWRHHHRDRWDHDGHQRHYWRRHY